MYEFLDSVDNYLNFLERVTTADESSVFEYDRETKGQSIEWHTSTSPRPKKKQK